MKIVLGAVLSRHPFVPGSVWNRIHRLVGLQRLGHDVIFVEEVSPNWCVDRHGKTTDYAHSVQPEIFRSVLSRFGFEARACQIYNRGEAVTGMSLERLEAEARSAELLINLSGHVSHSAVLDHVQRRVYIDEDPVYTQLWQAEYGSDLNFQPHDSFFSVGQNIGTRASPVPNCGLEWNHFLPPVVLDFWPLTPGTPGRSFTTVASLTAFGDLQYRNRWYRSKFESFRKLAGLPRRVAAQFEISVQRKNNEREARFLEEYGWLLADAGRLRNLDSYREYVGGSAAEIGIAKHAYVAANSGWFSDRSSHYLASGRPVLAQSTGLEHLLPSGKGFLTFATEEEAADGVERIKRDYAVHCYAAREFAAAYLDYRVVLPKFLETAMSDSSPVSEG